MKIRYKCWKLVFILLIFLLVSLALTYIFGKYNSSFYAITLLIISTIFLVTTILLMFCYIEIYDDKLIIKHGYFASKNGRNPWKSKESWLSMFMKKEIKFDNIEKVVLSADRRQTLIILKGNEKILISFWGYKNGNKINKLLLSKNKN